MTQLLARSDAYSLEAAMLPAPLFRGEAPGSRGEVEVAVPDGSLAASLDWQEVRGGSGDRLLLSEVRGGQPGHRPGMEPWPGPFRLS